MLNNNKSNQEINQELPQKFIYSEELNNYVDSMQPNKGMNRIENEQMFLEALFKLTSPQLRILNSYLHLASNYKFCYPSVSKISLNSGVAESTVQRFLRNFKNVFWFQEERKSQTHLIHVEDWLKDSYKDLISIIKHLSNVKDRKKYLINKCYNKAMSFKQLRIAREQVMNNKRTKMTPPKSKNDTQYSSSYSNLDELRPLDSSLISDEVLIKLNWKGFNINLQQKKYLSTNYSLNSIENAQKELRKQLRMEKPVKSEFGLLYHLANNFNNQRMRA